MVRRRSRTAAIAALLRKITVGDYVLMPDREEIWEEDLVGVNEDAGRADKPVIDPSIKATEGWVVEMMSLSKPNCDKIASGDVPGADLPPADRQGHEAVREELDRRVIGNLRHHVIKVPELDRGATGWLPRKRLNMDAGGWCLIGIVEMRIEGEGCEDEFGDRSRAALRKSGRYNSCLTPYNNRTWEIAERCVASRHQ
jgi:hypothetical protein